MRNLVFLSAVLGVLFTSSLRAQEAKFEVKMDEDTKKATARALESAARHADAPCHGDAPRHARELSTCGRRPPYGDT